ncbi:DUF397 domain-containing protein [Streptomyces sp. NPDC088246]|uniref:DUF397 domain-containing protein n=1 Tax=Streptomyces sp. NPDC088246 TaxID=3365842 RepID=UPI003825DDCA
MPHSQGRHRQTARDPALFRPREGVLMTNQPSAGSQWRKSSRSGGSGTECVEVADLQSAVGVRDSKQPRGPHIAVRHNTWARFVASLRTQ